MASNSYILPYNGDKVKEILKYVEETLPKILSTYYSKEEVNNLIDTIPKFNIAVVDSLPTENISSTTVYLVSANIKDTNNLYSEYIYVNNKWEMLGTATVNIDLSEYVKSSDITGVYRYKGIMDPNNLPENPSIGDTYTVGGESWDPILRGPDMTNATLTYYDEVFTLYCPDIFYYISESSGVKRVSLIVKLGDVGYNLKFDENNPSLVVVPANKDCAYFTRGYDNSKISVNKMYHDSDGAHNDTILYSDFVSEFNTFINNAMEYTNNLLGDFNGQQSYVIYQLIPEIGDNLTWNGYIWESTTNGSLYYTKNQVDGIVSTYETKTDSANKLQEAKGYTDTEIREKTIRLWQPNTEYKAGELIFYKPQGSNFLQLYITDTDTTSGSSFNDNSLSILPWWAADHSNLAYMATNDTNGDNIVFTYARKTELSSYSQKPTIITDNTSTTYNLEFLGSTNKIIRLSTLSELNFTFHDGEYNADLLINLVFTSGDTPTQISYPNTGILNWIGTDCALSEGQSIFAPAANTRYDIVFSFDGSQLVGYVCGYTPATVSNG